MINGVAGTGVLPPVGESALTTKGGAKVSIKVFSAELVYNCQRLGCFPGCLSYHIRNLRKYINIMSYSLGAHRQLWRKGCKPGYDSET